MSDRKEDSLDNLLGETRQLKDGMKAILPSYVALLEEISQLPEEFERRFWVSCVEAQMEKLKLGYPNYKARVQNANLMGMGMTIMMDYALKLGGMQPVPPSQPLQVGVSILPSGEMSLDLVDNPDKRPDAIIVAYEEFMAIVKRLENELLKGTIVPASEDEIPGLIYRFVSGKK